MVGGQGRLHHACHRDAANAGKLFGCIGWHVLEHSSVKVGPLPICPIRVTSPVGLTSANTGQWLSPFKWHCWLSLHPQTWTQNIQSWAEHLAAEAQQDELHAHPVASRSSQWLCNPVVVSWAKACCPSSGDAAGLCSMPGLLPSCTDEHRQAAKLALMQPAQVTCLQCD